MASRSISPQLSRTASFQLDLNHPGVIRTNTFGRRGDTSEGMQLMPHTYISTTSLATSIATPRDSQSFFAEVQGQSSVSRKQSNHREITLKDDIESHKSPQHNKADKGACSSKCHAPIWLILLLKLLYVFSVFCVIIYMMATEDAKVRHKAVKESLERSLVNARNIIFFTFDRNEFSLELMRKRHEMQPKFYACGLQGHDFGSNRHFLMDAFSYINVDPAVSRVVQNRKLNNVTFACRGDSRGLLTCNSTKNDCSLYLRNSSLFKSDLQHSDFAIGKKMIDLEKETYVTRLEQTKDIRWFIYTVFDLGEPTLMIALFARLAPASSIADSWGVGLEIEVHYLREILRKHLIENAHMTFYARRTNAIFATSVDIPMLNPATHRMWPMGESPHEGVNRGFHRAIKACPKECKPTLIDSDEEMTLAMTTNSNLGMFFLLVQVVPRTIYTEQLRELINLAAIAAVVTVFAVGLISVGIIIALYRPLKKLKKNFELAALMQNDLVLHTPSCLTELLDLSRAFDTMNTKLIVARAFMPAAYLHDDATDEGELEEQAEAATTRHQSESSFARTPRTHTNTAEPSTIVTSHKTKSSSEHEARVAARMQLQRRRVAVLAANVIGFTDIARDEFSIIQVAEKLVTAAQNAAFSLGGIVDSYHGDHFVITFNGTRAATLPGKKAALCALALRDSIVQQTGSWVSMGIAMGPAIVGSLGSATMRRFCVVGGAYNGAKVLEGGAKRLQRREGGHWGPTWVWCLMNTSSAVDAETAIVLQLVGRAQQGREISYVASIMGQADHGAEDEWLYQVSQANRMKLYNEAFLLLLKGDLVGACSIVAKHEEEAGERKPPNADDDGAKNIDLDTHCISPEDLAWERLRALLRIKNYEDTSTHQIIEEPSPLGHHDFTPTVSGFASRTESGYGTRQRCTEVRHEGGLPPYEGVAPSVSSGLISIDIEGYK